MKKRSNFLNEFITRFLGVLLIIGGLFIKIKYGSNIFSGEDILLIAIFILAAFLIASSWSEVKEYFVKKYNSIKEDFTLDEEDWDDE